MKAKLVRESIGKKRTVEELRSLLTKKERKIFDSILFYFPATDPESAYDKALQGGVKFQFIPK